MTVSECYVDMTFMEYDTVEEITVPEEAVSSAADSGASGGLDLPQDNTYGDESVVKPQNRWSRPAVWETAGRATRYR